MSKVNRILLLFVCFLVMTVMSIWQLLQSEFLAQIAINKFNTYLVKKEIPLNADFKHASFHFFPPGISLRNIEVNYKHENIDLFLYYQEITVEISPFEALRRFDEIDRVILNDGVVKVKIAKENQAVKKEEEFKLPNISELSQELPLKIKKITVNQTSFTEGNNSLYIESLDITDDEELELKLNINNISLEQLNNNVIDNIVLEAGINNYELIIKKLEIQKDLSRFTADASVNLNKDIMLSEVKKSSFKLETPVSSIHDYISFKEVGELKSGNLTISGAAFGFLDGFRLASDISLRNFQTSFVNAEKLEAKVNIDNNNIKVQEARLFTDQGFLDLLSPFELYNFKSGKFVEDPIVAQIENINLNNALRYLEDSLNPLKGNLWGKVTFILNENDFHFLVDKGSSVKNIGLVVGDLKIIELPELVFDFAQFDVFGTDFRMNVSGHTRTSRINVSGEIADGQVNIHTNNSLIDFSEIKKVANIDISGFGEVKVDVEGSLSNTQMEIETKLQNFEFFDIKLQNEYSRLLFDLSEGKIIIDEFVGNNFNSQISGYGTIDYENDFLDINVKSDEITFKEFVKTFPLFTGPLESYINDVEAQMRVNGHIFGGFSLEEIKVNASARATNLVAYDESFDFLSSKIALSKGELFFNDTSLLKGEGVIKGSAIINLFNQNIDWEVSLAKLSSSDITFLEQMPLSISAEVEGFSQGHIGSNTNIEAELNLVETKYESESLSDSQMKFSFKDNKGKMTVDLLDEKLLVNADVEKINDKFNVTVETILNSKIEEILKIISGIDTYNFPLTGNVESDLLVEIKQSDYRNANIFLNLKELNLYRKDLKLEYKDVEPEFIVKSGIIERWYLKAVGNKITMLSTGEGNLFSQHLIEGKNKIDAEILEIFSDFVSRSSGVLSASYEHKSLDGKLQNYELNFSGDDISISSDKLPIPIKKLDFKINAKDLGFDIEKFKVEFPSGVAAIDGRVDFKTVTPDINLDIDIQNVTFPIIKRAQVTVDGDLSLIGKRPPYLLSGDIKIIRGDVFTELADLEGDGSFSKEDYQYLPKRSQIKEINFLTLNTNISTLNPIRVSNSLARINLNADLQVTGGEKRPILTGRIYPTAGEKKIFFKGSEFLVNKANIVFNPNEDITNPEVDFFAVTNISDYKINVEAFGNVKDLNVRMSSDPSLPQEDILSLVAFGYTDDISNNLSADDKESITRTGVGALLFDSLKINETLKNEFGLQVNLGTEITQDEGSYLSGRTEGGTGSSRVRTATKVEVTKQLNDSIDLSVSSTVGGSVGQKQSMNLNYNLTNKVSIEGVYEMNTRNEGEEDNIDNSAGADLKFRWTFK